jgi:hypothetical protein
MSLIELPNQKNKIKAKVAPPFILAPLQPQLSTPHCPPSRTDGTPHAGPIRAALKGHSAKKSSSAPSKLHSRHHQRQTTLAIFGEEEKKKLHPKHTAKVARQLPICRQGIGSPRRSANAKMHSLATSDTNNDNSNRHSQRHPPSQPVRTRSLSTHTIPPLF